MESQAQYALTVSDRPGRLAITIRVREDGTQTLYTALRLQPLALSDRALASLLVRQPLLSVTTIALIGWHALRLRLRGVP